MFILKTLVGNPTRENNPENHSQITEATGSIVTTTSGRKIQMTGASQTVTHKLPNLNPGQGKVMVNKILKIQAATKIF